MRLALLEVGHWHLPLVLAGLEGHAEIVAVCDENKPTAEALGQKLGARAYQSYAALLDSEAIDFAFVFGRHRIMPDLAKALITRGIAFSLEKPGGCTGDDVAGVASEAKARGVWASVPFVNRLAPWYERLETLRPGPPNFASFTDIAGPPERYPAAGCAWMLDPAESGGGSLINLGIHFLDLAASMAGANLEVAGAVVGHALHGEAVEDHAEVLLRDDAGGSWHIAVGYGFPTTQGRHQAYRFGGRGWHLAIERETLAYVSGETLFEEPIAVDAAPLMARYVQETLDRFHQDRPPLAGLDDLARAMRLVDAAYHHALRE